MGAKLKVTGWVAVGALAGALTTMQLQAIARGTVAQLPFEELQQPRRCSAWSRATMSSRSTSAS